MIEALPHNVLIRPRSILCITITSKFSLYSKHLNYWAEFNSVALRVEYQQFIVFIRHFLENVVVYIIQNWLIYFSPIFFRYFFFFTICLDLYERGRWNRINIYSNNLKLLLELAIAPGDLRPYRPRQIWLALFVPDVLFLPVPFLRSRS